MPKQIINNKPLHLLLFFIFCVTGTYAQINYPFARQQNFDTVIYNQKLSDQYAWMSRPENETEMLAWAKAQGNFTDSLLDKISGDEKLYPIIEKLMQPNDDEIIVKGIQGNNLYYLKMMPDKKRWLMKQQGINGISEKITALPYTIHQYRAKKYAFAHTKPLLAIMLVAAGEANPHIRFFDLGKKEFLQDSIGPVMFNDASGVSMAWLPDDSGIIYSQAPSE
ncbi:MAG: hypothetical protein ABJA37_07410, partial [Ferruginibacter sp.]